jgi:hypothetical protein
MANMMNISVDESNSSISGVLVQGERDVLIGHWIGNRKK